MNDRVLILGSSGMAGHLMTVFFRENSDFDVIDVGPRQPVFPKTIVCNIEDALQIRTLLADIMPAVVVNCTGILVEASESRKREAVWFNAYLPHLLSELCLQFGIRLIHLSTDCVFNGLSGPYTEESNRDGIAFYDRSKALGELIEGPEITIRTSIIGPELRADGKGLFDWFMRQQGTIRGFRRTMWSGVTTLELARFVLFCIKENRGLSGLVHYSISEGISKFELLNLINEIFERAIEIAPIDEPIIDKRLICTRRDLGMNPESYRIQISALRTWMKEHSDLYPRYVEHL